MYWFYTVMAILVLASSAAVADDVKFVALARSLQRSEQLVAAAIRTADTDELRAQSKVALAVADQMLEYKGDNRYEACLDSAIDLTKIALFSYSDMNASKYIELETAKREFPVKMAACEKLFSLRVSPSPNLR